MAPSISKNAVASDRRTPLRSRVRTYLAPGGQDAAAQPGSIRARRARWLCGTAVATASACVFPNTSPTGMELSWRFVETNLADGDEGRRVRTCDGAGIGELDFHIQDQDDEARQGRFSFACADGFQTAVEFQRETSGAFIELHPSAYGVQVVMRGQYEQAFDPRDVQVSSSALALESFDLAMAPVTWSLTFANVDACSTVSLVLAYALPADDLADAAETEEGDEPPANLLYRQALATNRGTSLAGGPSPCDVTLEGEHLVETLDPGRYRLVLDVDGSSCNVPIDVWSTNINTTLDLANLPCAG